MGLEYDRLLWYLHTPDWTLLTTENYRLETKYENHLIVKIALVCIWNSDSTAE